MAGNIGCRDPRSYVVIKPLPIPSQKGLKIQARSPIHYNCWEPSREQVFRANYQRRQEQLSQQGYNSLTCKPYQDLGQPLYFEAKKLILHSLGQDERETKSKETIAEEEIPEETRTDTSSKTSQAKPHAPFGTSVYLRHREKDTKSFNKELHHTRQLIANVRQGRGYFYLLHKEEEAKKLDRLKREHLQHEKRKTDPQPPRGSTEEISEEEMSKRADKTRLFLTEVTEQQKEGKRAKRRPFTPIHNSLFSAQVLDADPESLFRQLCALHWLLESLNLEPSSAMRPVSSCWNIRDPGGCKAASKRINKEKDVELKWEQFIMPGKAKKTNQKLQRSHLMRLRKSSFLSDSRFSALSSTHTPTMGSVSSLIPSSDEVPARATGSSDAPREGAYDIESNANSSSMTQVNTGKEEEEPVSDYLQKLMEMIAESVNKDLNEEENQKYKLIRVPSVAWDMKAPVREEQGSSEAPISRPKTSPATSISSTSLFITNKSTTFSKMREMFFEVGDEAHMCLHDRVEAMEKRRQECNTQKYRSLDTISHYHQDLEKIRKPYRHVKEEKDYTDTENWFVVLLSRIPPAMKMNQKIHKILGKLQKLEVKPFIRIRPNAFFKVLSGLRTWELCYPDISVAIEFVREQLVQMPQEDYTAWLQTRLSSSQQGRAQSAPPMR